MSEFQDVGQFHKNDKTGKWRFQRLGYAKRNDKGGLDIYLDALPISGPYGVRMVVTERQEQGSAPDRGAPAGDMGDDMGDSIPFGPEWR